MEIKMTNLWSKRFTPAAGTHWKLERECSLESAAEWRNVFQKDEPNVLFFLSKRKPAK